MKDYLLRFRPSLPNRFVDLTFAGLFIVARRREALSASHTGKIIVKPCAGKLHALLEGSS